MTAAQKFMLMIDVPAKPGRREQISLFTQAAKVQGWDHTDRELRLKVFSLGATFAKFASVLEFREVLENYDTVRAHPPTGVRFRHLKSATDLNDTTDVDAIKVLLLMLADNLNATDEHGKPERGHGRRWRDVLADHIKCLALYPGQQPMGLAGAQAFVQTIINDKFNHNRQFQTMTLEDVDDRPRFIENKRTGRIEEKPSQMEQLLWTVNARLNGKNGYRAKAGHSMHDMYTAAGLPCACRACLSAAAVASLSPLERAQLGLPPLPQTATPQPTHKNPF